VGECLRQRVEISFENLRLDEEIALGSPLQQRLRASIRRAAEPRLMRTAHNVHPIHWQTNDSQAERSDT
jgi:hypothetical protein